VIHIESARKLLDFRRAGRISEARAEEQLQGAVAIHNFLREHRVAYLADEVGMGKTLVALGAVALFRHFQPGFRVLFLSPRENLQRNWQTELGNLARHNVRFADLRVRAPDGRPARELVHCSSLIELVRETHLDPDRDFFVRFSSFSLQTGKTQEDWRRLRDDLREYLPWMHGDAFDLRNKEAFKRNFGRALCCALPPFDLVVVDEAHNLKHGLSGSASARNIVLAEALGRVTDDGPPSSRRLFRGHGPRARRVLLLSATPIEDSYRQLWNQLDLFGHGLDLSGHGMGFEILRDDEASEGRKKEVVRKFLIRRVTQIQSTPKTALTKNQYRRLWRNGGVASHDQPIRIEDPRAKLVVALVQKKVSEILADERFKHSFQIGMLASFESFLETSRLKRKDADSVFDDADQATAQAERDGVDVRELNGLAKSYREAFGGATLPHPKMDALVESLSASWRTGAKALVFVRRVASVKELKAKLDESYDQWLIETLRGALPEALRPEFEGVVQRYREIKTRTAPDLAPARLEPASEVIQVPDDQGGHDTFFAWFFRGNGPKRILSGARLQTRFKDSGAYSTFFADNHVLALLGAEPGAVLERLAQELSCSRPEIEASVREGAARYLRRNARVTRAEAHAAAQAAALELLAQSPTSPVAGHARLLLELGYAKPIHSAHSTPSDLARNLERRTFFTELRRDEWAELRRRIWAAPDVTAHGETLREFLAEQELRTLLLATAARLGHAFIDLYLVAMGDRTSLAARHETTEIGLADGAEEPELINRFLQRLDQQRTAPDSPWGAFHELSELSSNFRLVLDLNLPKVDPRGNDPLGEARARVPGLLREQQPTGGMAGQVNRTLVRQFRMPGYPLVLVTTDLVREGENLHTFCSTVHHYGITWTPSAMEQRIGRIDRVASHTDRRLTDCGGAPSGADKLQVHFPFLEDTLERLQVETVLRRMDDFLRKMHEGLTQETSDHNRIDIGRALSGGGHLSVPDDQPLESAFPVPRNALKGNAKRMQVDSDTGERLLNRFKGLQVHSLAGFPIAWRESPPLSTLLGTATLPSGRFQPFALLLSCTHGLPLVRCISPIGRTSPEENLASLEALVRPFRARVAALPTGEDLSYDLTLEDEVLLGSPASDLARVSLLLARVLADADQLELEHFDGRLDQPLTTFEADLAKEQSPHA
jgi:helicase-like protein/type III restriction/modification enzyme restriction subunit